MKKAVRIKSEAGFSLIELMIVVAIIGILATVAIPNFQKFQEKARQSEGKGYLAAMYTGTQSFYAEWNTYTIPCLESAGYTQPSGSGVYLSGFKAALPAGPAGYTKPATCNFDFAPATISGGVTMPAVGALASVAPTASVFTASVAGNIRGGTNTTIFDTWTIDQTNKVTQTIDGI